MNSNTSTRASMTSLFLAFLFVPLIESFLIRNSAMCGCKRHSFAGPTIYERAETFGKKRGKGRLNKFKPSDDKNDYPADESLPTPRARNSESEQVRREQAMQTLKKELSLTRSDAAFFLSHPFLLSLDMSSKVWYLRNEMGLSRSKLRSMIIQHPKLVASVFLQDLQPTVEFLKSELNLSASEMSAVAVANPRILRYYRNDVRRKLAYLRLEVGLVDVAMLRKVILSQPKILGYGLDTFQSKVAFYKEELGLDTEKFVKMLLVKPEIFCYSIDDNVKPTIAFFLDEVGLSPKQMTALVARSPQILTCSIETNVKPTIQKIKKLFHLKRRDDIVRVITLFPQVIWLSFEKNLAPKTEFLRTSLNLSDEEVRRLMLTMPQVLGLSMEKNLMPKMSYYIEVVQYDEEELRENILAQPSLLVHSLEKRIKPRVEKLARMNFQFRYCPMHILGFTDIAFEKW
mmetsp:Transcript_16188/g.36424  ORF Transcript_16188/g.36424 Transcript_16188/m.36424 type:complete len:457 (+) Transcript_16188:159-1529(+)